MLFVLVAPSGAGKTTLVKKLREDYPEFKLSISSTTRTPRPNEVNGKDYFFLSESDFKTKMEKGLFLEVEQVHGNYYGTELAQVEKAISEHSTMLFDIDVAGADSLVEKFPSKTRVIFISPPSLDELEIRLRNRKTESEESLKRRLKNAEEEMQRANDFHFHIVNQDIDAAYRELKNYIGKELSAGANSNA